MVAATSNAGTWDLLRGALLLETASVAGMYLWAFVSLLRRPRPHDPTLRAMRIGRLCRTGAVLGILALAVLTVVARFERSNLAPGLIAWQVILFLLAVAWGLLDRTHYYGLADSGRVPAAGRAIETLAERELAEEARRQDDE